MRCNLGRLINIPIWPSLVKIVLLTDRYEVDALDIPDLQQAIKDLKEKSIHVKVISLGIDIAHRVLWERVTGMLD